MKTRRQVRNVPFGKWDFYSARLGTSLAVCTDSHGNLTAGIKREFQYRFCWSTRRRPAESDVDIATASSFKRRSLFTNVIVEERERDRETERKREREREREREASYLDNNEPRRYARYE